MPAQPRVALGKTVYVAVENAHGNPDDAGQWEVFCEGSVAGRYWAIRRDPYREIELICQTTREGGQHWSVAQ